MKQFDFYVKWLLIASILIAIFGVSIAFLKNSLLSSMVNDLFNPAFWPNNLIDEGTIRFKNLTWSLLGVMMAMWGIMLFGIVKNALSQKFHNQRAVFLARKIGINAFGYNAKDVQAYRGFKTILREFFARDKMFLDLFFGVKPKFLGEKILIKE